MEKKMREYLQMCAFGFILGMLLSFGFVMMGEMTLSDSAALFCRQHGGGYNVHDKQCLSDTGLTREIFCHQKPFEKPVCHFVYTVEEIREAAK